MEKFVVLVIYLYSVKETHLNIVT